MGSYRNAVEDGPPQEVRMSTAEIPKTVSASLGVSEAKLFEYFQAYQTYRQMNGKSVSFAFSEIPDRIRDCLAIIGLEMMIEAIGRKS